MLRRYIRALIPSFILLLTGCSSGLMTKEKEIIAESNTVAVIAPVAANGAIYQSSNGYHPLFEDRRPRAVGDILTIMLNERVSASKNSASNATRSGSASVIASILPDGLERLAKNTFDLSGENDFTGSGGSLANNTFTGTITVTVTEVLANGNLRVAGEKQIGINQGTEFIRFSGVVNPRTISAQNTVSSPQVADAHMEYVGKGYINEAQKMAWLQRFFLIVSFF